MTNAPDEQTGLTCDECGERERDGYALEAYHRGCRLKAAFPGAAVEHESGLVSIDMGAVAGMLPPRQVATTQNGVEFERISGRVFVSVRVQIANTITAFEWAIADDEWAAVVEAMHPRALPGGPRAEGE